MKNVKVKGVTRNIRYRLIYFEGECFLVDSESGCISYFFPFLDWFIPKKMMKLSKENEKKLVVLYNDYQKKPAFLTIYAAIAIAISSFLNRIDVYFDNNLTIKANGVVLCVFIILAITFRIQMSIRAKKMVTSIMSLEAMGEQKIRIIPSSIAYMFKCFGGYLLTVLVCWATTAMFLNNGNWLMLICWLIFFLMILFLNVFSILGEDYKVQFIKSK
ncbi:DUF443 family protein [uncultured Vagococcus sp.]|uniref:DUF443 family protein n=1 Tax=uncultured Vagococcus sp. TaxID=189676 RepID=UPI0028D575F7|nr:DUF443 family protein [uncultured Vagococcus sp.]